jgi:sulfatase maturation enzyme AslB (radical SAM superfamily)
MSLPSNFCPAPFIQLQTSKNGSCGPCPYRPNMWNVKGPISEQWRSDAIKQLRQNFLDNKKDPSCRRCWKEEEAGHESLRLRLREFRGSANTGKVFEKYIETKKYEKFPLILTVIPGNECNLSCPSCSGNYSSKWNSMASNSDYGEFQKVEDNWNLTEAQYQDIVDNSHNLQKIEVFGGEPFLNKKNRKWLIERLIEKGTSKNIKLYFNTNGTQFDREYMEKITSNFKFVEIRQSIDGLYAQFEYLRYGAKFDQIISNAEKFNALPNTDYEIICTVSIFNVLSLEDIDSFFKARNWSVYYNVVHFENHLLLHNIPDVLKKHIKIPSKFHDIEQYINMRNCNIDHWDSFVRYTKILDKNRGTSFKNTFPALHNLAKKHGYE